MNWDDILDNDLFWINDVGLCDVINAKLALSPPGWQNSIVGAVDAAPHRDASPYLHIGHAPVSMLQHNTTPLCHGNNFGSSGCSHKPLPTPKNWFWTYDSGAFASAWSSHPPGFKLVAPLAMAPLYLYAFFFTNEILMLHIPCVLLCIYREIFLHTCLTFHVASE